ncbi:MAG TPA: sigma-54 dependent transcriptional regulator [bacterium]|nr:sigma-54-dependent Fis family transcriptional regulator [Candidatus Omnitrophota bacterium]HOJ58961.1 sigma-54 dependent transcriptional regulator [bacterium]HOL96592.1 sigma-54 dependent transcriptional regulator [bacterium]HPO99614.1 sigma-54 dependent transcriptional regulator [bacterium]HXK94872.1 sigma-54 dependent transcriptional regulator [bacterium]
MKEKMDEHGSLKGVGISMLAPKGKTEKLWSDGLTRLGCKVSHADSVEKLIKLAARSPSKAIIVDYDLCGNLSEKWDELSRERENLGQEMIIIANPDSLTQGCQWARHYQAYLLTAPVYLEELILVLERALDADLNRQRLLRYEEPDSSLDRFGPLVVKSPEMKDIMRLARILATREDPILFFGAMGTGKELLAQTIHEHGPRRHGPFYAINCRSFTSEDLAVELFGRGEPGTPEASEGKTLIELCDGGTLLLDEIGVISPNVQGKLQRFLEDGTYTRVNSRTVCKADVRIFASTTVLLDESVAKGEFSEDLYFRLNRFTLHIPALRRRTEDIPVLTKTILKRMARETGGEPLQVTEEALKILMEYHWPGNVRELENALEFASLVAGKGPIEPKHLPKQFHDEVGSIFVGASLDELPPISEIERRYILRVMDATRNNKVRAAQILQINRATLHRKLQAYEKQKVAELE